MSRLKLFFGSPTVGPRYVSESHDGSTSTSDHTASSTLSIGVAAGRKVLLCVTFLSTTIGVTSATFNGVAMTLAVSRTVSLTGLAGSEIYYIDNNKLPSSGSYTWSVTVDGANGTVNATAIYLENAGAGPPDNTDNLTNTTTSITSSLTTTVSNCLIIDSLFNESSSDDGTPNANQTEVTDFAGAGAAHRQCTSIKKASIAGSTGSGWTSIDNSSNHILVSVVWRAFANHANDILFFGIKF